PPDDRGITPPPGVQEQAPPGLAPPLPHSGAAIPGARTALVVLLAINLFNYTDRTVLQANLKPIEDQLLPAGDPSNGEWLGLLGMAFIVSYMVFAPLFGWLADRVPRWRL